MFPLTMIPLWSVFIAGLLSLGIGMVWYSPILFASAWQRAMKIKPSKKGMVPCLVQDYIASVLTWYGLAFVLENMNALDMASAMHLSLFLGVLFVATSLYCEVIWAKKSCTAYCIDTGRHLVSWVVVAAWFAYIA